MADAATARKAPPFRLESERATIRDWLESFDEVVRADGRSTARKVLMNLERRAMLHGIAGPHRAVTAYVNTIPAWERMPAPGDLAMERRIEALVRWNAMAMIVRANRRSEGIGGHISTYASAATLFEVGLNHVFRGPDHPEGPDLVFFQGHASPGVYARAFVEGRLTQGQLDGFRRELQPGGGLSSYPHPWLMPDFWEMPTVSMGLSPLMAIHCARFFKYLAARGLVEKPGRVFAFLGDGEMDEPESLGALPLAGRERLDNLVFVVNCNLQRLDGPVRGNQRIVDELERVFAGAGWEPIKVLWAGRWDELFAADHEGRLVERFETAVDGDLQRWAAEDGATIRAEFFGVDEKLAALVKGWSDDDLVALFRDARGGHDIEAVHDAYARAVEHDGPVVILAQTVKGWGLGEAGEARNVSHKATTLDVDALRELRDRLGVQVDDDALEDVPYLEPSAEERAYVLARREALGGFVPQRRSQAPTIRTPGGDAFAKFMEGADRPATTTMVMARLLGALLRDEAVGELVVPIIPDEARTFGMEALFPRVGIYDPEGAQYESVDADTLTPYAVSKTGQLFEEGITEAGAMATAIAAGTAHSTQGVATIPFYFFYSMFGFQRVGDLIWAAGDARCRGFLIGATSGRTTLPGEGLQHQDGHSHLLALTHPHVRAYDPAFGYEVATIVQHGLQQMLERGEDLLYYLTTTNEAGPQPARPEGVEDGIIRGMYRLPGSKRSCDVKLLASGPMVHCALRACERLAETWDIAADVWSVTSWNELHRDAIATQRADLLRPEAERRRPFVTRCLGDHPGAVVAVSDYMKALPATVAPWIPGEVILLGTDGFGRSDDRAALREFFEVDDRWITLAALVALARVDRVSWATVKQASEALGIDTGKPSPTSREENDA